MPSKRLSKVRAMRSHIEIKFLDRLGFALSKKIRKQIILGIQNGRYLPVDYTQSHTRKSFIIHDIGSVPFKVVYSSTTHDLVTVMYLNLHEKMNVAYLKSKGELC